MGNKLTYFYSNKVLLISDGIGTMGGVRLELLGYLLLAWVMVYLVIWKGLQNSGKVNIQIIQIAYPVTMFSGGIFIKINFCHNIKMRLNDVATFPLYRNSFIKHLYTPIYSAI